MTAILYSSRYCSTYYSLSRFYFCIVLYGGFLDMPFFLLTLKTHIELSITVVTCNYFLIRTRFQIHIQPNKLWTQDSLCVEIKSTRLSVQLIVQIFFSFTMTSYMDRIVISSCRKTTTIFENCKALLTKNNL